MHIVIGIVGLIIGQFDNPKSDCRACKKSFLDNEALLYLQNGVAGLFHIANVRFNLLKIHSGFGCQSPSFEISMGQNPGTFRRVCLIGDNPLLSEEKEKKSF